MKELTDTMTQNEKDIAKKVGKAYLKVIKAMGLFLILGIILTGVAAAQAQPDIGVVQLDSGETAYMTQFYGEAGDTVQFAFGITEENGMEYQYPELDGPYEGYKFLNSMEWKVNMIVEYAPNIEFTEIETISDISGEANIINFELYKDGFYRIKITNLSEAPLSVSVGKAEINMTILSLAIVSWTLFGITIGLFTLMIHFGFWLLIIYVLVKAIAIIEKDNNRSHPSVIGPSGSIGPDNSQSH